MTGSAVISFLLGVGTCAALIWSRKHESMCRTCLAHFAVIAVLHGAMAALLSGATSASLIFITDPTERLVVAVLAGVVVLYGVEQFVAPTVAVLWHRNAQVTTPGLLDRFVQHVDSVCARTSAHQAERLAIRIARRGYTIDILERLARNQLDRLVVEAGLDSETARRGLRAAVSTARRVKDQSDGVRVLVGRLYAFPWCEPLIRSLAYGRRIPRSAH
jgi:hypothetical protein